jgi:hypothetical protein
MGIEQGVPFRVRLQQRVLDAVVNRLDEVASADRPDRGHRVRSGQRLQDGPQPLEVGQCAPDAQAVPVAPAPLASADPHVQEPDAASRQPLDAGTSVAPVAVPTIHDQVTGAEQFRELVEHLGGNRARQAA